jgi:uncharacterized protein
MKHDLGAGRIADGQIRYILMRPDVLMGIAKHLPPGAFLEALEESAAARAKASFEYYQSLGVRDLQEMMAKCAESAAKLGWGTWTFSGERRDFRLTVQNSPFAEAAGSSSGPVCAAICGVLRAMFSAQGEAEVSVVETQCAAHGADACRFQISDDESRTDRAVTNDSVSSDA